MERVTKLLGYNLNAPHEDMMGFVLDYFQEELVEPRKYFELCGNEKLEQEYLKAKKEFDLKFWDTQIIPNMDSLGVINFFEKMTQTGVFDKSFYDDLAKYLDTYYR